MVVAEGPNEYIYIPQNDHGDLAGQFAAHWGNETFRRLNRGIPWCSWRKRMITVGGIGISTLEQVDDQGVPITFRRTPRERLYDFINRGIDNLLRRSSSPLPDRQHAPRRASRSIVTARYPAVPRRQDEHTQKFIQEREPFYKELMAEVATMKEYEGVSSSDYLWFNYRMMQVFDRLSFAFLLQLRS